jgi:hypothetical protein
MGSHSPAYAGFGEVWLARSERTKERRAFKFCFQADRLRHLKRELTLFRLLKETLGERDDIARLSARGAGVTPGAPGTRRRAPFPAIAVRRALGTSPRVRGNLVSAQTGLD